MDDGGAVDDNGWLAAGALEPVVDWVTVADVDPEDFDDPQLHSSAVRAMATSLPAVGAGPVMSAPRRLRCRFGRREAESCGPPLPRPVDRE